MKSVDSANGTITIAVTTAGVARPVMIQTSKSTILRRYDPNSVKFDDAKVSTLDQLKPGDQLRARGAKNPDGSEVAADEIVSGAFRNLSGLITAIDASARNTLTVNDLATKKPVRVKIAADSQIRKLPPPMAQLLAGGGRGGVGGATGGGDTASVAPDSQKGGGADAPGGRGGRGFGGRSGADLDQMLSRLPASNLTDLQKGDAVMIVSTEGTTSDGVTAITVVGGVEPLLESKDGQSVTLPPWSLGGGAAGGDAP